MKRGLTLVLSASVVVIVGTSVVFTMSNGCGGTTVGCKLQEPSTPVVHQAQWHPSLGDLVAHDDGEAWLTPYFIFGTNLALPLFIFMQSTLLARTLSVEWSRRNDNLWINFCSR